MIIREAELYKNFLYRRLKSGKKIDGLMIKNLKNLCDEELSHRRKMIDEYQGNDAKIYHKKGANALKVCTKLSFNYKKVIVNQVSDYIAGTPIMYQHETDEVEGFLDNFARYNDLEALNRESLEDLGACGACYRLMYIEEGTGEECCINLPADCVITLDNKNEIGEYGFYFYTELDESGKTEIPVCEFYDNKYVYTYKGLQYDYEGKQRHLYNKMPIINAYNTKERKPDFFDAMRIMDEYDEIVSTHQDEIMEFRNAYMIITGARLDEEAYSKIIQTGCFEVPENAKVEFLTKEMDVEAVATQRQVLLESIFELTDTIDMKKFSDSSESGESRKWKLIMLENRAKRKIHIMRTFLKQMFRVLETSKKAPSFEAHEIDFLFNRSLPIDERYIGECLNLYKGIVSLRTLLTRSPYIENVDKEMEQILKEREMGLWGEADFGDDMYKVGQEGDPTSTSTQVGDVKGVDTTVKDTTKTN